MYLVILSRIQDTIPLLTLTEARGFTLSRIQDNYMGINKKRQWLNVQKKLSKKGLIGNRPPY